MCLKKVECFGANTLKRKKILEIGKFLFFVCQCQKVNLTKSQKICVFFYSIFFILNIIFVIKVGSDVLTHKIDVQNTKKYKKILFKK